MPGRCERKLVVDTNVILFDALALSKFRQADIYVPLIVIEEVDKFKKDPGGVGRNARHFSRFMDTLRTKGSLSEGVFLESSHSYIYVCGSGPRDSKDWSHPAWNSSTASKSFLGEHDFTADNLILRKASQLQAEFRSAKVELITRDINLRIKADVMGIPAFDYKPEGADKDESYTGFAQLTLSPEDLNSFFEHKQLEVPEHLHTPYANQYVGLQNEAQEKHTALGRYDEAQNKIVPLIGPSYKNGSAGDQSAGAARLSNTRASSHQLQNTWGVRPRNREQHFAMDALLRDDIPFVSLVGKAGTGKTLLALAAGLFKTLDENKFQRLLVSRPIFPMGRDLGYLPGDVEQKLNPWMQPIFDSIEFLMGSDKKAAGRAQELVNQGMINIEPLTYIRGRSIPRQYLIVDEAQNLTPHEIKTIITRAGQGTKIVLTGDYYQIDNPYVDSASSGLTYAVERFKGEAMAAHVLLQKGERSPLAELAANIL